jgi:hypothetical protein
MLLCLKYTFRVFSANARVWAQTTNQYGKFTQITGQSTQKGEEKVHSIMQGRFTPRFGGKAGKKKLINIVRR